MKRTLLILVVNAFSVLAFAQAQPSIALIPIPVSLQLDPGHFILPPAILIEAPDRQDLGQSLEVLKTRLSQPTGSAVTISKKPAPAATIRLLLSTAGNDSLGAEGYRLSVTEKNIIIRASQPAGLFYGVQTLLQLFPKEIEGRDLQKGVNWQAPCVTIMDRPRFSWRGLMLDVSRHFFTKDEVKSFIDGMVKYKYNLLHMHLTDDEGWRVEIKSLPNLTKKGAWNVRRTGTFGTFQPPAPDEARDNGGFYTQDDIRELVKYAKDRFVDILPEIDCPGHSLSAIVSYPELSCTPGAESYQVNSGEKVMIWPKVGRFYGLVDNTLCPANEKVYPFLDKVFTELASLFPFGYIHVGGDECARNFWEKSDAIKQLMQKEGLKTLDEVQSYFEKRVEKIVESKGKKVIGWDEILEGGLAPNAVVMSWRGIKGGIQAAKMGHEVVMSPTTFAYLDYMQGDAVIEPPVYATLRLKTAYSFEPVPDSVDAKLIKGGQANLWTEQVYNTRHLQYMIWPRAQAIAECLWSPKEKKDWNSFARRTEINFGRMDMEQIKYARSMFDPIFTPKKDSSVAGGDSLRVELSTEVEGLVIHYSFDNSNPDNFYPSYSSPLSIPKEAVMLKVITYRDGRPIGRQLDITVKELRRRAGLWTGE
ncbi:MAG TPA: family 20 glycosylhydrolase [Puia sp.]|nr:family 20 glycosylhydrolase [Puia sp.]